MGLMRDEKGQSIVLGAISLLVLTLVMLETLNISHVVHEKIRVQNYADARAYSLAVQEARSFNYFAYTNRGIAASYVSMAALHAYYSEVTMLTDAYAAAAIVLGQVASQEFNLSKCICTPFGCIPCSCFQHCIHAGQAIVAGVRVGLKALGNKPGSDIRSIDGDFQRAVKAYNLHANALYAEQVAMQASMARALAPGSMRGLKDNSQNEYTINETNLMLANGAEYARVFDNQTDRKRKLMTEIANATRPDFVARRENWLNTGVTNVLLANFLNQKIRGAAGGKGAWSVIKTPDTFNFQSGSRSGMTDGHFPGSFWHAQGISGDVKRGMTGKSMASYDWGILRVDQWIHGSGSSPVPLMAGAGPGEVYSGSGNHHQVDAGLNFLARPHTGSHALSLTPQRFTEFKISARAPFNQPSTFAAARARTDTMPNGAPWPWNLSSSGSVSIDVGDGRPGQVQLSDPRNVTGVSKGMAYYHRFGDWRDVPNFWNPYWRAKLEPMTALEAGLVLVQVDRPSAALVAALGVTPFKAAVNIQ